MCEWRLAELMLERAQPVQAVLCRNRAFITTHEDNLNHGTAGGRTGGSGQLLNRVGPVGLVWLIESVMAESRGPRYPGLDREPRVHGKLRSVWIIVARGVL